MRSAPCPGPPPRTSGLPQRGSKTDPRRPPRLRAEADPVARARPLRACPGSRCPGPGRAAREGRCESHSGRAARSTVRPCSCHQLELIADDGLHDDLEVLPQDALGDRIHHFGRAEPRLEGHVEGDLAVTARRGRPPPPLKALEVARDQLECDAAVVWLDPFVLDPFEDAVLELDLPGRALVTVAELLAVDGDHGRRARRIALKT